MVGNFFGFTPILFSAIGASCGFYFLSNLDFFLLAVIFFILFLICVLYFSFLELNKKLHKNPCKDIRQFIYVFFCFVGFSVGLSLGVSAANAAKINQNFTLLPNEITAIEGILKEDPRIISGGNAMAILDMKKVSVTNSVTRSEDFIKATAFGEITVIFPSYSKDKLREYGRGSTLYLEGNLFKGSGKDEVYLFNSDTVFVVKPAGFLNQFRTNIRLNLINKTEHKEWGGLTLALLLGIRDNLDSELSESYRKAGCSYILALSGMHLAVLTAIIAFLLKKPLGLKPASIVGALFVIIYCILVGPMPSLYRAAIMYIIGVITILNFLPKNPLSILSLSFLIQICATPYAGTQISFILSYLALFGIFIIGFCIYEIFAGLIPDFALQPVSASLGAFIATLGVTGYFFGYASPIGIIAGLFLIPLTTLYMIFSILWLLFSLISGENVFSYVLSFLYNVMEKIISFAAKIPVITANNPNIFIIFSIIISILIVFWGARIRYNRLKLDININKII